MNITVRSIQIKPTAETPRHWFGGKGFETHFFNALSSTFPEGERFFIQSVRRYADGLDDPALAADVAAFAGQEGQHSREHDAHMDILFDQGFTGVRRMNRIAKSVFRTLGRYAPRFSLALTTAIEHVTAVTAHQLLSFPERWLDPMDGEMRLMWHWHAVEEAEHKAVAFDVYQATGNGYLMRVAAHTETTIGFLLEVFARHVYLLAKDNLLLQPREWTRGVQFLWGRNGFLRAIGREHWRYLRRDFHPSQQDDRALIDTFVARYGNVVTNRLP